MNKNNLKILLFLLPILLIISLIACANGIKQDTDIPQDDLQQTVTFFSKVDEEMETPSLDSIFLSSESPVPSKTSFQTRDAVGIDWQAAPIMPEFSERTLLIYLEGREKGRDSSHFSVIGDCQSIPYVFLGPFGRGELEPDIVEQYLWDAIGHFRSSIDRWSVTSRGGFTAASLLSPIQADPQQCKPGETPLTCEYRLNNPAYVFITLELWDNPETIERYEVYLRGILDYVIAQGTIPILLTKADAAEVDDGSHVINPAIVRIAYEYDIPLVNFWRAAQYLDNIGIDPDRDGFHLSQEGYDLKNTLALRALYNIWQSVESRTAEGSYVAPASTPTLPPVSEGSTPPVLLSPVPKCIGNCIFFSTAVSVDGVISSQGVFLYDYASKKILPLLGRGFDLQDVSEDGNRLLVNHDNYLYAVDLSHTSSMLVTNTFIYLGRQGAYWNNNDSQVIAIDQANPFFTDDGAAITLFPSNRDGEVYFEAGSCASKDFCQPGGLYRQNPDLTISSMETYSHPVFSPDGNWMAFLNPTAAVKENYFHIWYLLLEDPGRSAESRRTIYLPTDFPGVVKFLIFPEVRNYAFSPKNSSLSIMYDVYSEQFESSVQLETYFMDLTNGILYDIGKMAGKSASLDPHQLWSPDGERILFFLADTNSDGGYRMSIYQTDLLTGEKLTLFHDSFLTSSEYFYITNMYWR